MRKLTIEQMRELAIQRNGLCLSESYKDANTPLLWQCSKDHQWKASPHNVKDGGQWCPVCAGHVKRTIEEMQKIAVERGGRCLSTEYVNNRIHLKWRCKEGHEWLAKPHNILTGTWCPMCAQGVSETICRIALERSFKTTFSKAKPEWLVNARGGRMELDGYAPEIKLAFEYNGIQHYKRVPRFFHSRHRASFEAAQSDDKLKQQLCRTRGVRLIVVPYTVQMQDISEFLYKECKKLGIDVKLSDFDWKLEDVYHSRARLIEKLRKIAEDRGGKCLSQTYTHDRTKMQWQCQYGHTWEAIPGSIVRGSWCPFCFGRGRTIEDMRETARKKGGVCLSEVFVSMDSKLKWMCKKEHIWDATPFSVMKQNSWCPHCRRKFRNLEDLQRLAKKYGGECLSTQFTNSKPKYRWKCREGHEWNAVYNNVAFGQWCPVCAWKVRKEKLTKYDISNMREVALKREGECLSEKYLGQHTRLRWRCKEGHEWWATPTSILSGSWCKICGIKRIWVTRRRNSALRAQKGISSGSISSAFE